MRARASYIGRGCNTSNGLQEICYNNNLEKGDLCALKDNVLAEETFTFRHGEIGVVSDFIPPRSRLSNGVLPKKVILRMLKYDGYRVPVYTVLVLKLDVTGSNGDLINYLHDLDDKKKSQ